MLTPETMTREDPRPVAPGNIWSGNPALSHFTNPTELAFRKGTLKVHLPVEVNGVKYSDAEQAYQLLKRPDKSKELLMAMILYHKLSQHHYLWKQIQNSGGLEWVKKCSHNVTGKSWWEGDGLGSPFIFCLYTAYANICDERRWLNHDIKGDVPW